jgi:hypothetical protein
MSRWERYGTRDLTYSNWHRFALPDDAGMIDLDGIDYCRRCSMPVAAIETARDVGQAFKATTVTEIVARCLNVPAWLVLYTPAASPCACEPDHPAPGCNHGLASMRVRRVYPRPTVLTTTTPGSFAAVLVQLHESHRALVCVSLADLGISAPRVVA